MESQRGWQGCSAPDGKALQRPLTRTSLKIISWPLPSNIASSHYLRRAINNTKDSTHPAHHLSELPPSGRWYRSAKTHTSRLKNSFLPHCHKLSETQPALRADHSGPRPSGRTIMFSPFDWKTNGFNTFLCVYFSVWRHDSRKHLTDILP